MVEGSGQVGHELWCDRAAYNMHRLVPHLVVGKDCCRSRCDSTHAIITGTRSIVVPDARLDDSGHSCLVHLETIGLGDSISLKSSPQLARPDSMHSKTAAWNKRTAAQSYFDARHIKVIKCDVMRDWLGGGVAPLKCQDNHTQILPWKDLWISFEKDRKEHVGEATLGGYHIYPCIRPKN